MKTRQRLLVILAAVGLAAGMVPVVPGVAHAAVAESRKSAKGSSRGGGTNRVTEIHATKRRLGTLRQGSNSASTIGLVSFLVGGPLGWGIYRGVDQLTRKK